MKNKQTTSLRITKRRRTVSSGSKFQLFDIFVTFGSVGAPANIVTNDKYK